METQKLENLLRKKWLNFGQVTNFFADFLFLPTKIFADFFFTDKVEGIIPAGTRRQNNVITTLF